MCHKFTRRQFIPSAFVYSNSSPSLIFSSFSITTSNLPVILKSNITFLITRQLARAWQAGALSHSDKAKWLWPSTNKFVFSTRWLKLSESKHRCHSNVCYIRLVVQVSCQCAPAATWCLSPGHSDWTSPQHLSFGSIH